MSDDKETPESPPDLKRRSPLGFLIFLAASLFLLYQAIISGHVYGIGMGTIACVCVVCQLIVMYVPFFKPWRLKLSIALLCVIFIMLAVNTVVLIHSQFSR